MGNQASSDQQQQAVGGGDNRSSLISSSGDKGVGAGGGMGVRGLWNLRNTGTLGLSKSELDERCKPSGLYPNCLWDDKQIRRWMGDGKLAPRLKGNENRQSVTDLECPICFLHYSRMNVTKCCQAYICTECFLQVRKPPHYKAPPSSGNNSSHNNQQNVCPFCNCSKISIQVAQLPSASVIQARQAEEQRVLEAKLRARNETEQAAQDKQEQEQAAAVASVEKAMGDDKSFGSSLDQNERVALWRARSSSQSFSESNNSTSGGAGDPCIIQQQQHHGNNQQHYDRPSHLLLQQQPSEEEISACAMTADERSALEAEMRAQHQHPLTQRIQQEEAERRLQNQLNYYYQQQNQQQQRRAMQQQQRLAYGGSSSSSADRAGEIRARHRDLIMGSSAGGDAVLTMNGPPGGPSRSTTSGSAMSSSSGRDWNRIVSAFEQGGRNGGAVQSLDDLVVLEAAIMLSMEEEARQQQDQRRRRSSRPRRGGDEVADGQGEPGSLFDAARHASQGFPLARARAAAAAAARNSDEGHDDDDDDDDDDPHPQAGRFLRSLRGSGRRQGGDGFGSGPASELDPRALIMRGMSEEDQIALAIAASLQDQQSSENNSNNATNETTTDTVTAAATNEDSTAAEATSNQGDSTTNNNTAEATTTAADATSTTDETGDIGTDCAPADELAAAAAIAPPPPTNTASMSSSSSEECTLVAQTGLSVSKSKLDTTAMAAAKKDGRSVESSTESGMNPPELARTDSVVDKDDDRKRSPSMLEVSTDTATTAASGVDQQQS